MLLRVAQAREGARHPGDVVGPAGRSASKRSQNEAAAAQRVLGGRGRSMVSTMRRDIDHDLRL